MTEEQAWEKLKEMVVEYEKISIQLSRKSDGDLMYWVQWEWEGEEIEVYGNSLQEAATKLIEELMK